MCVLLSHVLLHFHNSVHIAASKGLFPVKMVLQYTHMELRMCGCFALLALFCKCISLVVPQPSFWKCVQIFHQIVERWVWNAYSLQPNICISSLDLKYLKHLFVPNGLSFWLPVSMHHDLQFAVCVDVMCVCVCV